MTKTVRRANEIDEKNISKKSKKFARLPRSPTFADVYVQKLKESEEKVEKLKAQELSPEEKQKLRVLEDFVKNKIMSVSTYPPFKEVEPYLNTMLKNPTVLVHMDKKLPMNGTSFLDTFT